VADAGSLLIDVRTAASRLGCSVRIVWQMLSQGVLTKIRPSYAPGRTLISAAEVEAVVRREKEAHHAAL
jgi:hypothetical protein